MCVEYDEDSVTACAKVYSAAQSCAQLKSHFDTCELVLFPRSVSQDCTK